MGFQATFCIITAALISGAIVERMRFSAYLIFICLWSLVVYARSPLGLGRRMAGGHGRAGFRRRHRRARECRRRGAGCGDRRRKALRLPGRLSCRTTSLHAARRGPALVRLVRIQRGQRARGQAIAALAFTTTMLAPAATLVVWTILDMMRQQQADCGRRRDGDRGRPGCDHSGRGIHRPDECHRAWRDRGSPELLRARHSREDMTRRFAGRRRRARRRRDGRRASDRRLRGEGPQRRLRRPAVRQSRSGRHPGRGRAAAIVYSGVVSFILLKLIGLLLPLRADAADEATGLDVTQHGEEAYLHERGMTPASTDFRPAARRADASSPVSVS